MRLKAITENFSSNNWIEMLLMRPVLLALMSSVIWGLGSLFFTGADPAHFNVYLLATVVVFAFVDYGLEYQMSSKVQVYRPSRGKTVDLDKALDELHTGLHRHWHISEISRKNGIVIAKHRIKAGDVIVKVQKTPIGLSVNMVSTFGLPANLYYRSLCSDQVTTDLRSSGLFFVTA